MFTKYVLLLDVLAIVACLWLTGCRPWPKAKPPTNPAGKRLLNPLRNLAPEQLEEVMSNYEGDYVEEQKPKTVSEVRSETIEKLHAAAHAAARLAFADPKKYEQMQLVAESMWMVAAELDEHIAEEARALSSTRTAKSLSRTYLGMLQTAPSTGDDCDSG